MHIGICKVLLGCGVLLEARRLLLLLNRWWRECRLLRMCRWWGSKARLLRLEHGLRRWGLGCGLL